MTIRSFTIIAALSLAPLAAPARSAAKAPVQGQVQCKDGSYSSARSHGACSHHGGVVEGEPALRDRAANDTASARARTQEPAPPDHKASKSPWSIFGGKPAARAPNGGTIDRPSADRAGQPSANPTARCRDGSASYSQHHSGACSHHGGVAQWMDGK